MLPTFNSGPILEMVRQRTISMLLSTKILISSAILPNSNRALYTSPSTRKDFSLIILALTAVGMLLPDKATSGVPLNLVSGLPIGFFKENHKRFNELLVGHHTVTYHTPDGQSTDKSININDVRMLPQPMGTILNLVMDERGKISEHDLAHKKIGVIDIGFRTTDLAIMDRLRFLNRGSKTIDMGISKGFSVIANKLREKSSVNAELCRLYRAAETGTISMRGQDISISKIRDQVYSQLAAYIAGEIDRLWANDWDIEVVFLSGGGSRDLANFLQPLIAGNIIPINPSQDLRLNNVKGYLKYGRHIWGDASDDQMPEREEEEDKNGKRMS